MIMRSRGYDKKELAAKRTGMDTLEIVCWYQKDEEIKMFLYLPKTRLFESSTAKKNVTQTGSVGRVGGCI